MRHRWKKIPKESVNDNDSILAHVPTNCKECIHCGLKKGNIRKKGFPMLAYFKYGILLSTNRLPYKCIENSFEFSISEKEFKI